MRHTSIPRTPPRDERHTTPVRREGPTPRPPPPRQTWLWARSLGPRGTVCTGPSVPLARLGNFQVCVSLVSSTRVLRPHLQVIRCKSITHLHMDSCMKNEHWDNNTSKKDSPITPTHLATPLVHIPLHGLCLCTLNVCSGRSLLWQCLFEFFVIQPCILE